MSDEIEKKIKALTFQWWLNAQPIETTMELYANLHDQLKDKLGDEFEPFESEIRGTMIQTVVEHGSKKQIKEARALGLF
jgi:hypothetical protein